VNPGPLGHWIGAVHVGIVDARQLAGASKNLGAPLTSGRRFFIFADGPDHLCPSQEGVAHDRLLVPIQPAPAQVIVPSTGIS
jgi:hypothetical protein